MVCLSHSGTLKLVDRISEDHDVKVHFWSHELQSVSLKVYISLFILFQIYYFASFIDRRDKDWEKCTDKQILVALKTLKVLIPAMLYMRSGILRIRMMQMNYQMRKMLEPVGFNFKIVDCTIL